MQIEHEYGVPPLQLLAVLTDADYLRERGERLGVPHATTVEHVDGTTVITTPRQIPLHEVPSAFRRYIGDGALMQTDTFTEISKDRVTGTWAIDAGRAPVAMKGTHEITASGTGSRYVVSADVKVTVPLVGGILAGEASKHLTRLLRTEQEFLASWVQR